MRLRRDRKQDYGKCGGDPNYVFFAWFRAFLCPVALVYFAPLDFCHQAGIQQMKAHH